MPAARPSGSATPREVARKRSFRSRGSRSRPTRWAGLVRAGVERVIVSCASGQGSLFEGRARRARGRDRRGGGAGAARSRGRYQVRRACPLRERRRLRTERRRARGRRLRRAPRGASGGRRRGDAHGGTAEVAVRTGRRRRRKRRPRLSRGCARAPYWVNCGNYVLSREAIERFPDRGDHETTTFPELAAEGRLHAYRHSGLWLTVNTPKELRVAAEHVESHPEWLA